MPLIATLSKEGGRELKIITKIASAFLLGSLLAGDLVLIAAEESLDALIRAQGVSGREEPVRRVIASRLPEGAHAEVDNLGNLTMELGSGRPLRLVLASMDEPGYVVTRIQEDGYLRVRRLSRLPLPALFDQYFVGQPVQIAADDSGGTLPGVSAVLSTHLQRGRRSPGGSPPPRDEDLLIDVGARSQKEAIAAGVRQLAPMTLEKSLLFLAGSRISGFALDDRIGCEALLRLARGIDSSRLHGTLVLAWTAQSWVEFRGAKRLAQRYQPDELLVVDLHAPDPPGKPSRGQAGTPGKGPFLARSEGTKNRAQLRRLRDAARRSGVSIQQMDFGSQHEGTVFPKSSVAVVGIPVRFPGTPAEVADLRDLKSLTRWLQDYLEGAP